MPKPRPSSAKNSSGVGNCPFWLRIDCCCYTLVFIFQKKERKKRKSTRKNDNNQGLLNSRSPSFRANNLFASLPSFPIGRLRGRRCNEPLHPEFSLASLSLPELANETGTGNGAASLSIIKGTAENGSRSRQLRASSPTVYRRSL